MRRKLPNIKVFGKNKNELYASFLIVFLASLTTLHLPHDFNDLCVTTVSLLVGFFCYVNAMLDIERMKWFERGFAVLWSAILFYGIQTVGWELADFNGVFSDR